MWNIATYKWLFFPALHFQLIVIIFKKMFIIISKKQFNYSFTNFLPYKPFSYSRNWCTQFLNIWSFLEIPSQESFMICIKNSFADTVLKHKLQHDMYIYLVVFLKQGGLTNIFIIYCWTKACVENWGRTKERANQC